ncbi:IclR family transcriptional regulator [Anaerotignum sp.]|uniref:IclR family transcriptional regulator n=1 Tax=Anaerotignum sp. TaxID=2039241 RepID=UPI0028AE6803|nr:IclR family transcriptional regulator [Anaerotignum sp.]
MEPYVPKYPLHTLSNALEVLNVISQSTSSDGMTLSAISEKLNLNKSTIHRILDTLLAYNFVEKTPGVIKTYRLSWGAYKIGNSVPKYHTLNSSSYATIIEELSNKLNRSCILSINNEYASVTIYKVDPLSQLPAQALIGARNPLYATASGKLFMLNFTNEEIKNYFQHTDIKKFTSNTILNYIDFLDELSKIKTNNYAMDNNEYEENSSCIAMPIRDYTNKIVAAISVNYSTDEVSDAIIEDIKIHLKKGCNQISSYLGYNIF